MKKIIHVKCIVPFTLLQVHNNGYCYSCCPSWTILGNIGKLSAENSIMKIWNSEKIQYMRTAILEDKLGKICNYKYCPIVIKNEYLNLKDLKNDDPLYNRVIDQIMSGKTILDRPPNTLEVASSGKCNLKCVMCQSNDKRLKDDTELDEYIFNKAIPESLPDISKIFLMGNGEVFFNPYSRKFLQSLDANRYPVLKIEILTNGLLLTPNLWETIRHNHYDNISVSIDAASRETYERIRNNGKWDNLREKLQFIGNLRRQNHFKHFSITFVVMKSNYHEMKDFAELGIQLKCDKIIFQKIFGFANVAENINLTRNKKIFSEIAGILTDPIFNRPDIDTTLIDEYRNYSMKRAGFIDEIITKSGEVILSIPCEAVFSLARHFSFIYKGYNLFLEKHYIIQMISMKSRRFFYRMKAMYINQPKECPRMLKSDNPNEE